MTDRQQPARDDSRLGLGAGWNLNPEWPVLLLDALTDALQDRDPARLAGFATLGIELAREGHVREATAIGQLLSVTIDPTNNQLRDGQASSREVVESVLSRGPARDVAAVATDRLAGVIADSIEMDREASELNWRAGEGFDALGDANAAGLAYQAAGSSWLWLGEMQRAASAAARAVDRFSESGDLPREAEALITQTEAAIELSNLALAEASISRANELALRVRSAHLNAVVSRTQARIKIELGDDAVALQLLRRALRGSRRVDDPELEAITLQDLAILTESTKGPKGAAAWWAKALACARTAELTARELDIARGAALNAMRRGELDWGVSTLDQTLRRHRDTHHRMHYSRANADWGALLLTRGSRALEQGERTAAEPDFEAGEGALRDALVEFASEGDSDWSGMAARNLKLSWRLQGKQCEGTTWLRQVASAGPAITVGDELRREAAQLGVSCPEQRDWAAELLRFPWTNVDAETWAMTLAHESLALDGDDLLQDTEGAVALMQAACDVAARGQHWSYGDLVNDLGVRLGRAEHVEEADMAFGDALAVAEREDNRALMSLALANLAELRLRRGDTDDAHDLFSRSAALAEEVRDIDLAISSWAGAAKAHPRDDTSGAAETARRLAALASEGASPEGQATALSAEATAAFARGAYVKASSLWQRAARLEGRNRGEHLAFALDSLAHTRDRSRYERELERIVKNLGRGPDAIDFSSTLLRAAYTWAAAGDIDAAGLTVATSTAIAAATLTSTRISTDPRSLFLRSLAAMRAGQLVVESIESEEVDIAQSFDRQIREIVGDEPADALIWILRWATDDADLGPVP